MNAPYLQTFSEKYGLLPTTIAFVGAFVLILCLYWLVFRMAERFFGKNYLVRAIKEKCYYPGLFTLTLLFLLLVLSLFSGIPPKIGLVLQRTLTILLIGCVTFLLIRLLAVLKAVMFHRFDIKSDDNLQARKVYTQFQILERVIIFVLVIFATAIALMTFDSIRQIGVSLLASAGVLGIILGFAAQKSFSTIFAGIQIAIAQPIRLDDVVVLEGEWGRIEEIMLTYVTVRLWDNRRLIVPVNYFLDKPFQNWTRISSQITGTVYLHVDYAMPIQPLRTELDRILEGHPLWDGEVKVLQVTDSTERTMQLRVLVSADTSGKAWDLRCDVREKLIDFMQKNYGHYLPKNRWELDRMGSENGMALPSPEREGAG